MQRKNRDGEVSGRVLGKRIALAGCGAVSVWFIVASVAQIIPAVFGAGIVPLSAAGPDRTQGRCAEGLREAAVGASTGFAPSAPAPDDESLAACGQSAAGLDALAAYSRLRAAEAQLGGKDARATGALDALRRDLSAHLPAEMR
jgi:hypothetical protein